MASSDVQRKLTAILCTDVVGYSRLMGDDHEGTLKTLTEYRQVFSDKIQEYKGRVVNAPGDSILADFPSVVDAVSCAVDIQRELAERNQELPDNRRMDFRIGVNLGDVLVKDGDIYGDGVNVAARLESLAEPGGICISGSVHEQVKTRLPLHYEFIGEQRVKNIAEPVKTYRVLSKPGAAAHRVVKAKRAVVGTWKKAVVAVVVVLLLVGAGAAAGWYWKAFSPSGDGASGGDGISGLREKPSIAVLPFNNLSGDPELEYFSDGLAEAIITDLSKIQGLVVIARNSSFTFKGKPVKAQQVGRELGVKNVLEGSVQVAGERIRINAQLIDAATGSHLWAERYDRVLKDLFALQDEIVEKIVTALEVSLTMDEVGRVRLKTTDNLEAWRHYVKGLEHFRRLSAAYNFAAKFEFEKALALDREFEAALLGLGWTHYARVRWGWGLGSLTWDQELDRATQLALRAIELNKSLAEPLALLGAVHFAGREFDKALSQLQEAVVREPGVAEWQMHLASVLSYSGKSAEALAVMRKAMQLNPFPTDEHLQSLCIILYQTGRYEDAIRVANSVISRNRLWPIPHLILIAGLSNLSRMEQAKVAIEGFNIKDNLRSVPGPSRPFLSATAVVNYRMPFRNPEDTRRLLDDLAKAGMK